MIVCIVRAVLFVYHMFVIFNKFCQIITAIKSVFWIPHLLHVDFDSRLLSVETKVYLWLRTGASLERCPGYPQSANVSACIKLFLMLEGAEYPLVRKMVKTPLWCEIKLTLQNKINQVKKIIHSISYKSSLIIQCHSVKHNPTISPWDTICLNKIIVYAYTPTLKSHWA